MWQRQLREVKQVAIVLEALRSIPIPILAAMSTLVACDIPQDAPRVARAKAALGSANAPALASGLEVSDLLASASRQLGGWLDVIPAGQEEDFGFRSRDEFSTASLGKPYAMFGLRKGALPVFLNSWRIPVLVSGEFRALAHVKWQEGRFMMVSIGSPNLAAQLEVHSKAVGLAADTKEGVILHSFPYKGDFLVCPPSSEGAGEVATIRARSMSAAVSGSPAVSRQDSASKGCTSLNDIDRLLPSNPVGR
jgi:hypothetical protein